MSTHLTNAHGIRHSTKLIEAALYLLAAAAVIWQCWRLIVGPTLMIELQISPGITTFLDVFRGIAAGDPSKFLDFMIFSFVLAALVGLALWLFCRGIGATSHVENTALDT